MPRTLSGCCLMILISYFVTSSTKLSHLFLDLRHHPFVARLAEQRARQLWISRFTSFTDAPLSVVIDRLFDLLSESEKDCDHGDQRETEKIDKPKSKILTFSDGRQDAAYFASDFQRTHTEFLYRQSIWNAFQATLSDHYSTITEIEQELQRLFRNSSIPHPDRDPEIHHKSYSSHETNQHLKLKLTSRDLDNWQKKDLVKFYYVNSVYPRPGGDQWSPLVCWHAM